MRAEAVGPWPAHEDDMLHDWTQPNGKAKAEPRVEQKVGKQDLDKRRSTTSLLNHGVGCRQNRQQTLGAIMPPSEQFHRADN